MTKIYKPRTVNGLKKTPQVMMHVDSQVFISNKLLILLIDNDENPLDFTFIWGIGTTVREFLNRYSTVYTQFQLNKVRENLYKNATVEQQVYMKMAWGI